MLYPNWKGFLLPSSPKLLFRAMKLTATFLLIMALQVSATGFSQDQKVSIRLKKATISSIFAEIEKQSNCRFVYSNDLLDGNRKVDVNVKDEKISNVLQTLLYNTGVNYVLMDKSLIVLKKLTEVNDLIVGKVSLPNGAPAQGITVSVKGTNNQTATNDQGIFRLDNVAPNAVLVLTGVSIETMEVPIAGKKNLDLTVKLKVVEVEEIQVLSTGYQTISKERATGSYNIISKEQLEKPSTNIAQRLIGTTAGMQARSMNVDGNPVFEIRGQTSLTASAQPLVVVDGFAIQGDFNTVNPNDVESVTILKDAAASSIWGARSANGVIVITTKNAKKGVPLKVDFSSFIRMGQKFDLDYVRPLASSAETVEYEKLTFNRWSAQLNSGAFATNYGKQWSLATVALSEAFLGFMTNAQRDAELERLKTLDNRQQISDNLLANPVTKQYNLSLYGSSSRLSNSLSLMFEDNQSNFKETGNKRYMANFRTTASLAKWVDLTIGGMLLYTDAKNNGVSLGDIQGMSPYEMLINENGDLNNINRYYWPIMQRFVPMNLFPYADWTYNPITEIKNRSITNTQLSTRLQAGLSFKIIKGLTFDSRIQYELFNSFNRSLYNENTFQVRSTVNTATTWNQTTNAMTPNLPKGSMLSQSRNKNENYVFRNQLTFSRVFDKKHAVDFAGGIEASSFNYQSFSNPMTYGYNDNTLTVGTFPNGPGGTFKTIQNWLGSNQTFSYTNSFSYTTDRYFGAFGNLAYTYNGKYVVSGSARTDASNLIAPDPTIRNSPFWSAGIGWHMSKEDFMQNISWLDRLFVKATFGYNGNVDKSTSPDPLISMGANPNTWTNDYTATISSFGNPTLRWEKTGATDIGADFSLFRGKLFGKVGVYNKAGKDLIATLSIPAVNGSTSQRLNNAEMINRGFELELGTTQTIAKNVIWSGSANFSYNFNKITKLFVANYAASTLYSGGSGAYVVGENANSLWRFIYAGVTNTQPMVQGAKGINYDFGAFTPGDGREYMVNPGTTVAPYTFGMINSFKIHDFNVSFILTGKFGHVFQRTGFNYPPTWTSRVLPNNKLSEVLNGDPSKIVPLPYNDVEPRYYFWNRFHQYLSYLIEDASHLRLQELSVAYSLPRNILSKINVGRVQLYAQGNDLFTILMNNAGEDPDYLLGTMNPRPKLTLGFKLEF